MSTEEIENPPHAPEPGGGLDAVGNRLAVARRQQKLEPGTVASRLHLTVEVVNAIEAGNLSALPAMTFVRGYIKSYARLLGLDEKNILALLPSAESYRPAPLRPVGMTRARRRRPVGKWLLWSLGAAALAVVVVYGVPMLERLWKHGTAPADNGALQLPLGEEHGLPALPPEDSGAPVEDEPAVVPESEYDGDAMPPPAEALQAPPADDAGAQPSAALPEPLAGPEPPAEPGPSAEAPSPAADASGPAMITLRFSEDSWVEMESHGRKLVVGTQPAGTERSVRAEPPIQVLLGNAPGVTLEYRGEPVDLKRYQRGNVARLVLED